MWCSNIFSDWAILHVFDDGGPAALRQDVARKFRRHIQCMVEMRISSDEDAAARLKRYLLETMRMDEGTDFRLFVSEVGTGLCP